jgi:hypothetical protein
MTKPRRRAPGAATSRSRPPASPTHPVCAQGLMRAGSPIGPTWGWGVVVVNFHHRLVARGGDGSRRRRCHRGCLHRGRRHCRPFPLRPCGHNRVTRRLANRRHARRRPRRPRRMPPHRHGHLRPEHPGRRKGGDDQCYPANGKHKGEHRPLEIKDALGKCRSPQGGEAPLPLPRGFRGAPLSRLPALLWHSPASLRRTRALPLMTP